MQPINKAVYLYHISKEPIRNLHQLENILHKCTDHLNMNTANMTNIKCYFAKQRQKTTINTFAEETFATKKNS